MDRAAFRRMLLDYGERHPDEGPTLDAFLQLVDAEKDCFRRDCFPGHITASAWIVSRERGAALLTHHRKLDRWLQLGGHTDGEADVLASAIREAEEESGLRGFEALPRGGRAAILDLDVHAIPAIGDEPPHSHHDVRFLLEVSDRQPIQRQQAESNSIRWFDAAGLARHVDEESLLRLARKAADWLGRDPAGPG